MTLWNPLNLFSIAGRRPGTNRPHRSILPAPATRSAHARASPRSASATPASAQPSSAIPAAIRSASPPRGTGPEPRFRTEISFKRHHELPRASALPAESDVHTTTAWQSPEPVEHDVIEDALVE